MTNGKSVLDIVRERGGSRDGRIVFWGSVIQIPPAIYELGLAWIFFPNGDLDHLLVSGLLHLATPFALVGTFVGRGGELDFRESAPLTVLLLLIAAVPFLLSTGLVK